MVLQKNKDTIELENDVINATETTRIKANNLLLAYFIMMILVIATVSPAQEIVVSSDFNVPNDRDGWIHSHTSDGYTGNLSGGDSGSSVTWDPLNGGCLRCDDAAQVAGDFFIAPSKFHGDWYNGYSGGLITFDYKKSEPLARPPELWICNGTDKWVASTIFPGYSDSEWHSYSVSLNESDWVHVTSSNPTTWEQTLQNITDVGVIGELKIGKETTYFDNFKLTLFAGQPEPPHDPWLDQFLECSAEMICLADFGSMIPYLGLPFDYYKYGLAVCEIDQLLDEGYEQRAAAKEFILLVKIFAELEEPSPVQFGDIVIGAIECVEGKIWEILKPCGGYNWSCIKEKWPELLIESLEMSVPFMGIFISSPVDLRVHDSQGNVMELNAERYTENGLSSPAHIFKGPDHQKLAMILDASDIYVYELVGTGEGTYRLDIVSIKNDKEIVFEAIDIPTSPGVRHVYVVDWEGLSVGGDGVTLEIDANGDGIFERTVIADEDLSSKEFALQTETVIDFEPDTLNLRSRGRLVTAYIELPEAFDVSNIDVSTLKLNEVVSALSKPIEIGDYDEDGTADLMVKFNRQEVIKALCSGTQMVTLTGFLSDGRILAGIDFIRVIDGESIESTELEAESVRSEGFTADIKENPQSTDNDSVETSGEDEFDIEQAIAFILFEAIEIVDEFDTKSFNDEESAFELSYSLNEVFTLLDEGMYVESLSMLENYILQRMDGYANIGQPDEDDWITSIEGQALLYPRVMETIGLLESML